MSQTALAESDAPTYTSRYARLTRDDLKILRTMLAAGKTQVEIAQAIGCSQPTVSKWVDSFTDSRDDAKAFLAGKALDMAQNIVKRGRAADHVAALKGLSVLEDSEQRGGLTIIVGGNAQVQVNVGALDDAKSATPQVVIGEALTQSK